MVQKRGSNPKLFAVTAGKILSVTLEFQVVTVNLCNENNYFNADNLSSSSYINNHDDRNNSQCLDISLLWCITVINKNLFHDHPFTDTK